MTNKGAISTLKLLKFELETDIQNGSKTNGELNKNILEAYKMAIEALENIK